MINIPVSEEQYTASQSAMAAMLEKEFAIKNQSPSKIRYLVSQVLLYSNHHQLESLLKSGGVRDPDVEQKQSIELCRLKISNLSSRLVVGGTPLSKMYVCDNCDHIDEEDNMEPAENLSQRLDVGGAYTEVQCPHCGALAYSMHTQINNGLFDGICKNTKSVSVQDAVYFADNFLTEYSAHPLESEMADALRAIYLIADFIGKDVFRSNVANQSIGHLIMMFINIVKGKLESKEATDVESLSIHDIVKEVTKGDELLIANEISSSFLSNCLSPFFPEFK